MKKFWNMIANGILFRADFDMSKYTEQEILKQFNPASDNSFDEEIQATPNVVVLKETVTGKEFKMISYRSKDTFVLDQIYESSRFMEEAAPKLIKVVEINPEYFLVAFPYFPTSCEFCDECDDDSDFLSEEDEDRYELSKKIEDTVKELARVTMYFIHENNDPKVIQDKVSDYVSLCYKFVQQAEDEELISMDDIAKNLEDKLLDLWKNQNKDEGDDDSKKDND